MPSDETTQDDDYLRHIGRQVARIRRARGLTQKALAQEARLSESYVFRVEQGANMSVQTLLALARALSVPVTAFFGPGEDPVTLPPISEETRRPGAPTHLREPTVERISNFVQGLKGDERRRAIRLLQAAFPGRSRET